jgi:hypothetical protein
MMVGSLCKDNRWESWALWIREGVNKKHQGTTVPDAYLTGKRKDDRRQPQTTNQKGNGLNVAKYRAAKKQCVFLLKNRHVSGCHCIE